MYIHIVNLSYIPNDNSFNGLIGYERYKYNPLLIKHKINQHGEEQDIIPEFIDNGLIVVLPSSYIFGKLAIFKIGSFTGFNRFKAINPISLPDNR